MRNTQDTRVRHAFVLHFVHHFLGFICSVSSLANSVYNLFDSQSVARYPISPSYYWFESSSSLELAMDQQHLWLGSAKPSSWCGWAETFAILNIKTSSMPIHPRPVLPFVHHRTHPLTVLKQLNRTYCPCKPLACLIASVCYPLIESASRRCAVLRDRALEVDRLLAG